MMRSLYSGVAGLKTHQTKMDVIGNNIANVNTVGFKSSSVNFTDTFYQTISSATAANATTGTAGTNAKQIGLGSMVAAITTNITENGGTSSTNRALDIAINGEAFLIVKSEGETMFTKSGALNVDAEGNLYCTTNGAVVQGWLADEDGNIVKDTVQDLKVMSAEQQYAAPTATTDITMTGNIDKNDTQLTPITDNNGNVSGGLPMSFSFYDQLGEMYTVKLRVTQDETQNSADTINYSVRVEDVMNSDGKSIFVSETVDPTSGQVTYAATGAKITWGGTQGGVTGTVNATTGEFTLDPQLTQALLFNSATGEFGSVPDRANTTYSGKSINFSVVGVDTQHTGANSTFPQYDAATDSGGIEVDFSNLTQYSKGGTSDTSYKRGTNDTGAGAGNYAGTMNGISIDENGLIYGSYNNGEARLLGQIAVASFSNPSGLEAMGNSLFAESRNSGEFDGIGEDVSLSGNFTVGALEMSNVDLANEFTQMIITQRGFQANSRIITTSDTMLEELVNLKR